MNLKTARISRQFRVLKRVIEIGLFHRISNAQQADDYRDDGRDHQDGHRNAEHPQSPLVGVVDVIDAEGLRLCKCILFVESDLLEEEKREFAFVIDAEVLTATEALAEDVGAALERRDILTARH